MSGSHTSSLHFAFALLLSSLLIDFFLILFPTTTTTTTTTCVDILAQAILAQGSHRCARPLFFCALLRLAGNRRLHAGPHGGEDSDGCVRCFGTNVRPSLWSWVQPFTTAVVVGLGRTTVKKTSGTRIRRLESFFSAPRRKWKRLRVFGDDEPGIGKREVRVSSRSGDWTSYSTGRLFGHLGCVHGPTPPGIVHHVDIFTVNARIRRKQKPKQKPKP